MNNPAKTPAQQKLFAIALGIKRGQISRSYSSEAAKMADRMSERKLREFAETKFKNPTDTVRLGALAAINELYDYRDSELLEKTNFFLKRHLYLKTGKESYDLVMKQEYGPEKRFRLGYSESVKNLMKERPNITRLQKNLLPEIGAAVILGVGAGLGYKTAGRIWRGVTGEKKNPILLCPNCGSTELHKDRNIYTCYECGARSIKVIHRTNPQTCPKCGKVYNDDKWGGVGFCECGHYFHPEWYGKKKKNALRRS